MDDHQTNFSISEMRAQFGAREIIGKNELRDFLRQRDPALTEQAFRRALYFGGQNGILLPIGAGIYALPKASATPAKRQFSPRLSGTAQALAMDIRRQFPYTRHSIWETSLLHEFMLHQPVKGQMVIEVEKDACESVFNYLREAAAYQVFWEPDRITLERYVMHLSQSILIIKLLTQAPTLRIDCLKIAKLEKILVDIFSDEHLFPAFQGQEMIHIFENAFRTYWINPKTLFRYAGLRKVAGRLKYFLNAQTEVNLSAWMEDVR